MVVDDSEERVIRFREENESILGMLNTSEVNNQKFYNNYKNK